MYISIWKLPQDIGSYWKLPKTAENCHKSSETGITLYCIWILSSIFVGYILEVTTRNQRLLQTAENLEITRKVLTFVLDWDIEPRLCISFSVNYHKKSEMTRYFQCKGIWCKIVWDMTSRSGSTVSVELLTLSNSKLIVLSLTQTL